MGLTGMAEWLRLGFLPTRGAQSCWSSVSRPTWVSQCRRQYASHSSQTINGVRSTLPSSASPAAALQSLPREHDDGDRGYLAFTKASLFKLTLPLQPPSKDSSSIHSKFSSAFSQSEAKKQALENATKEKEMDETREEAESSAVESDEPWELIADRGERISQIDPMNGHHTDALAKRGTTGNGHAKKKSSTSRMELHGSEMGEPADDPGVEFDAKAPAHSVVFLLHSAQPLSYVSSLIEAEGPGFGENETTKLKEITFHSRARDSKRWSPSTSIGDFLRDAARIGSFAIRLKPPAHKDAREDSAKTEEKQLEPRNIVVSVPSFEDRTRFLRSALYAKTGQIERMAKLKGECDALARLTTRRFAIAGGFILGGWWVTVFSITFLSNWGWDLAEPLTYLCGLGTLMAGYTWFLVHNREVSYRAVLTETTSRRQQRLYVEKGFNLERYEDLIDECKELRKQIRKVAEDYDLEWDQSKSASGHYKRALDIVEKREASEKQPVVIKSGDDDDDGGGNGPDKDATKESEEEKSSEKEGGSDNLPSSGKLKKK